MEETAPDLDPAVRSELVRRAHGNPMVARHYAASLSPAQRAGTEPLSVMLPLPAEIMDAYAETLDFLPADVSRLLLLAAVEPGVAVPVLTAEATTTRWRHLTGQSGPGCSTWKPTGWSSPTR